MAQQAQGRSANETASPAIHEFSIPAQPLSEALIEFGQQSGLQVSASSTLVESKQASAVKGAITAQQALSQLLAGTGLIFRSNGAMISLETASGATTLPPVKITAEEIQPSNSPPEYAGGQVARGGRMGLLGNKDMMDTPFNQTSYTSKLIENQQSRHISDALRNDPSVVVTYPKSSGNDSFLIRGFQVSSADIQFNGMSSVVAPSFGNSMVSESVERVEVLKGPNALLNGMSPQGSIGGAINVVPKRAGDQPLTQLTADYATDSQFGGHLDIGRRFGEEKEFGVRFNGVYRDGDTPIDHQTSQTRLAAFGLDYQGDRFRVELDLGNQYTDLRGARGFFGLNSGLDVPDVPDTTSNAFAPWEHTESEFYYGALRGEVDITPEITAFAAVGGNRREKELIESFRMVVNADGDLAATSPLVRSEVSYGSSAEGGLRGHFKTGSISHQATLAYAFSEREWRQARANHSIVASNIYDPVFSPAPAVVPSASDAKKTQDVSFKGVVVADTLSFLNEQVLVTAGVRYQEIDDTSFNRNTGAITREFADSEVTPLAGIVLKPWDGVSLYANYIEGLQKGAAAPATAANPDFVSPPFVTEQYEVGAKWDMGYLTTTLAAYEIANPNAYTDPSTNIFDINGEQRHQGIDLNVFGEMTDSIRVLGGIGYVNSEQLDTANGTNDGNRGPGVPEFRFVLGGEWDTPFLPNLTVLGRLVHQTSTYLDAGNTLEVDGWARFDVGARYTIEHANAKPTVVRVWVDNLFDKAYWNNPGGYFSISDPRTFKLSATFRF